MPATTIPTNTFPSALSWQSWLQKNHSKSRGLHLRLTKKSAGPGVKPPHIDYAEILDIALCYGWIDGQRRALDATTFLQKFTPRARRSIWSKNNREKADALIKAGRMQPAGLAEIERAKADGRWAAAYDSWSSATIPKDLATALKSSPRAAAAFKSLDSRNRYAILFRIQTVKKAQTRARKIAAFVAMLAAGGRIYP